MTEKSELFFICFKRMKNIFQEESFNHNLNLCNKHKNDHVLSLSLFQKSAYIKKIISVSKEDTNQFYIYIYIYINVRICI